MREWYDYVLKEFGNAIGAGDLSFSGNKAINLNIEDTGNMFLELSMRGISLSMLRSASSYRSSDRSRNDLCLALLEKCHFDSRKADFPVQVAMNGGDNFVFIITFNRENFQLHNLHKAIEVLKEISLE